MEGGVIRGHEVSVAAHDEKRQIQMELCKDMSHCSEKLIYDRDEAGVEKRPCAPSEYIPVKTDQDQPAVTPFPLDTCICGKGGGEGERPAGAEQILRKTEPVFWRILSNDGGEGLIWLFWPVSHRPGSITLCR